VVAGADIALSVLGRRRLRRLTKPALMPLLARHALTADSGLVAAGLGLSWLGDVALLADGDGPFTAGLSSFLAAHLCYLVAFRRRRANGVRRAPWLAVSYLLAWLVLNFVLWPRTGKLRVPVLAYGTALVAMALAALDTNVPAIAAGGAAFVLSDGILALDTFCGGERRWADPLVMSTYTVAQALIATGHAADL
jgi:uncharacterized membrane protein YhhN